MNKKTSITLLLPLAALVASPAWAGHITLDNQTGQHLRLECGGHDHAKHTGEIAPGYTAGVPHRHGEVRCRAIDNHGDTVDSRYFDFEHDSEEAVWRVRGRDHHNDDRHSNNHHSDSRHGY